jgi:hypothetical protein
MEDEAQIMFPDLLTGEKIKLRGAATANNNSKPAQGMRGNNTCCDLPKDSHLKDYHRRSFSTLASARLSLFAEGGIVGSHPLTPPARRLAP